MGNQKYVSGKSCSKCGAEEFKEMHPEWSFRMRGDILEDNRKGFFEATPEVRVSFVRQEFVRVFDSPDVVVQARNERKRMDENHNAGDFARYVNVTVRVVVRDHFSDGSAEEKVVNWTVENLP